MAEEASNTESPASDAAKVFHQEQAILHQLAAELGYSKSTIAWIKEAVIAASEQDISQQEHTEARKSIGAEKLCEILIRDLNELHPGDLETTLEKLGIRDSSDIGRIVWTLVEHRLLQADGGDKPEDFSNVFSTSELSLFLEQKKIRRRWVDWSKCKHWLAQFCYVTGFAVVMASYSHQIPMRIAWIGWGMGMVGFALHYVPDPKPKRFPNGGH